MKIGFAHRRFSSTGGSENFLLRFAAEARRLGHECVLFTAEWPQEKWPHGELIRLKAKSQREFADALLKLETRQYCDFLFGLDRIWSCDCYRAGGGVHQVWLEQQALKEPKWRSLLRKWQGKNREVLRLERSLFSTNGTKFLVTNSKRVKQEIVDTHHYPAGRIKVVYNGIPKQQYDSSARARLREKLGFAEEDYVAIFVGNGWERKGLATAISAINRLTGENNRLVVLGRGKRQKLPNSKRVHFIGATSPVNDWLAMADVFILPTLYDPFSNACLEAATAGLPVITSSMNGFAEIIKNGEEGSVVENPHDVEGFTAALAFWNSAERRVAARDRILELAGQFSIERNVRETLEWFQRK